MKRIVGRDAFISMMAGVLAAAVAAVVRADAGATYLIAIAFAAILIGIRLGPERVQLWRARRGRPPVRSSPRAR